MDTHIRPCASNYPKEGEDKKPSLKPEEKETTRKGRGEGPGAFYRQLAPDWRTTRLDQQVEHIWGNLKGSELSCLTFLRYCFEAPMGPNLVLLYAILQ